MDFIDKINKTFSNRHPKLIPVVSNLAAPKTLVQKLPKLLGWIGKLWKTRKIHSFYQHEKKKNRKYTNYFKLFSVLYLFHSYVLFFNSEKNLHQNIDFLSFSWNSLCLCYSTDIMSWAVCHLWNIYFSR